ncbi:MAG TPA: hypothetical protein VI915_04170 [Thermoplasmata archaeon]|nr:hypothetical protein [Thermoplasmata archaeon]
MHLLLLVSLAAMLAPSGPPADPMQFNGGGPYLGISFDSGCAWPGYPFTCQLTLVVSDPSLVFFRWDFDGDGNWDMDWTGEGSVAHTYTSPAFVICAQGWDGVKIPFISPYYQNFGPVTCRPVR